MWSHLVASVLGIWLMLAPWLLGFEGTPAEVSHRIAGPIIATFSTTAWWQVLRGLRVMSGLTGVWLLVAPLVVMHPEAAIWNGVAVGLAVIALSSVRGKVDTRYGGGWRALWKQERPGT